MKGHYTEGKAFINGVGARAEACVILHRKRYGCPASGLCSYISHGGGHLSAARAPPRASPSRSRAECGSSTGGEAGRWWATFLGKATGWFELPASLWVGGTRSKGFPSSGPSSGHGSFVMSPAIEAKIRQTGATRVVVLHHLIHDGGASGCQSHPPQEGRRVVACTVALDPFTLRPYGPIAPLPCGFQRTGQGNASRAGAKPEGPSFCR
jgi:hypothetical protein